MGNVLFFSKLFCAILLVLSTTKSSVLDAIVIRFFIHIEWCLLVLLGILLLPKHYLLGVLFVFWLAHFLAYPFKDQSEYDEGDQEAEIV